MSKDSNNLNDKFYFDEYTEVCNFADDTTPNSCGYYVNEVLTGVEHNSSIFPFCLRLLESFDMCLGIIRYLLCKC